MLIEHDLNYMYDRFHSKSVLFLSLIGMVSLWISHSWKQQCTISAAIKLFWSVDEKIDTIIHNVYQYKWSDSHYKPDLVIAILARRYDLDIFIRDHRGDGSGGRRDNLDCDWRLRRIRRELFPSEVISL